VPSDIDALFKLKNHINQSVDLMNGYLQILTNQQDNSEDSNSNSKPPVATHDVGTQSILITPPADNNNTVIVSKPIKRETRNKKLQVDLPAKSCNRSSCNQSLEKINNKNKSQEVGVQCAPVLNNSVAVQCSLKQQQNDDNVPKKSLRKPLNVLSQNGNNIQVFLTLRFYFF